MLLIEVNLFFALLHSLNIYFAFGEDVLGCGGYVQSDVEINFSVIEVKLYSKQGSLKYSVDPAPNSGYYMVPVYDKGDYVIKVEPPPGWSFEPNQYPLHIDGATDACSKQKDLNFRFRGFGITGKVLSAGSQEGPAGITLAVTKEDSSDVIKTVVSQARGNYVFSDILPGRYVITASHSSWKFEVASTPVTVGTETGLAERTIVVGGYDVRGSVTAEGDPVRGAIFVLMGDGEKQSAPDCSAGAPAGFSHTEATPICHVTSDAAGNFVFLSVSPGRYQVIPFYKGDGITFDVVPSRIDITVEHTSLLIKENFQVAGFSVTGRVVEADETTGVPNADVSFNSEQVAVSREDGTFSVDSVKTGIYSVTASAKRRRFASLQVKISPSQPRLPSLKVARYEACGQLTIEKPPPGLSSNPSGRKLSVTGDSSAHAQVAASDGAFCTYLPPGKYSISPVMAREEQSAGLSLAPTHRSFTIGAAPVDGLVFSQFRASLHGSVLCIEPCPTFTVHMHPVDKPDHIVTATTTQVPPLAGHFRFKDVLPGKYRLKVLHDSWCWQHKTLDIDVTDRDLHPEDMFFMHEGYLLVASMSHSSDVKFTIGDRVIKEFQFNRGVNRICLPEQGLYKVIPSSCFKFEQEAYTFDASRPSQLKISAVSQQLSGVIRSSSAANDIKLHISSAEGTKHTLGPLKLVDSSNNESFSYNFEIPIRLSQTWQLTPTSSTLLFHPASTSVSPDPMSCPYSVEPITARAGKFLKGAVKPALAGVKLTIASSTEGEPDSVMETNAQGQYKAGPLTPESEYTVSAALDGYVILPDKQKLGDFLAYKLGEIIVNVADAGGSSLQGVLLSVSGGEGYRSNQQTEVDKPLSFLNLQPGQYFVRPMMKEYRFEPSSSMVEVSEGGTVSVDFSAVRIAYSCYGSLTSLTGEAEPGVLLEARGRAESRCAEQEEESKTEPDGKFRLRGLQPGCTYDITIKATDVNSHIERITPDEVEVTVDDTDVTGVRLLAFRKMAQVDVSGFVTADPEHINSLKVHLSREESPTVAIHTFNLNPSTTYFYFPPLQPDGQRYMVRLESTLARSQYEYTLPEAVFSAEKYFHFFKFNFTAKRRSIEHELGPGSYLTAPLTLILLVALYNYGAILPAATSTVSSLVSLIRGSGTTSWAAKPAASDTGAISEDSASDTPKRKPKPRKA